MTALQMYLKEFRAFWYFDAEHSWTQMDALMTYRQLTDQDVDWKSKASLSPSR